MQKFSISAPLDTASSTPPPPPPPPSHPLSPNLRRQHQSGAIIAPPELGHHGGHLGGAVLVHEVSRLGEDVQLVLALHLGDGEVGVETVGAGEEEQLGAAAEQELGAQPAEPGRPEGLREGERGAPGVGCWVGGVCFAGEEEGGHGYACGDGIADCAGPEAGDAGVWSVRYLFEAQVSVRRRGQTRTAIRLRKQGKGNWMAGSIGMFPCAPELPWRILQPRLAPHSPGLPTREDPCGRDRRLLRLRGCDR